MYQAREKPSISTLKLGTIKTYTIYWYSENVFRKVCSLSSVWPSMLMHGINYSEQYSGIPDLFPIATYLFSQRNMARQFDGHKSAR